MRGEFVRRMRRPHGRQPRTRGSASWRPGRCAAGWRPWGGRSRERRVAAPVVVGLRPLRIRGGGGVRRRASTCLVAPNESGKSTLAAGLTAVLFGLPAHVQPRRVQPGPLSKLERSAALRGHAGVSAAEDSVPHPPTVRHPRGHGVPQDRRRLAGRADRRAQPAGPPAQRAVRVVSAKHFRHRRPPTCSGDVRLHAAAARRGSSWTSTCRRLITGAGTSQFADALRPLGARRGD